MEKWGWSDVMPLSANDKQLLERIENDFTYHAPRSDQVQSYERLRAHAKGLAKLMVELCPDGRERSLALTNLESAIMFANAAIARHDGDGTS